MLKFPDYILTKKFEKFCFFQADLLFSDENNYFKTNFVNFLNATQSGTNVKIGSLLSKLSIDFKDYLFIYNNAVNSNNLELMLKISESPCVYLFPDTGEWEIYSNTVYNLMIFGYNKNLSTKVDDFFINNRQIFKYENTEDYIKSNSFIFRDPKSFKEEFIKNYSNQKNY